MNENDLQINITAVDQASETLDSVAQSADQMGQSIANAAEGMQGALESVDGALEGVAETAAETGAVMENFLTPAEEAIVEGSAAISSAWMKATEDMGESTDEAATGIVEDFDNIAEAADQAAESTVISWEESQAALTKIMEGTEEEAAAAFAAMGEDAEASATKATGSMSSMHSYFRALIAGYLAETAGKSLIGAVSDAVTAAAGDPTKLQQMNDQLTQLLAQREKLSQPISGKGKTTGELDSDEAQQAAQLQTVNDKIKQLQPQIEELKKQQEIGGQAAKDYAKATDDLNIAWTNFLATAGAPLLDHLAKAAESLAHVIELVTQWSAAHPKLTEEILITIGVLGTILTIIGGVLIAVAPLIILLGFFEVALSGAAAAGVLLVVALVAAFTFFEVWFIDHVQAWSAALQKWGADLRAALSSFWTGMIDDAKAALEWIENKINDVINLVNNLLSKIAQVGGGIIGGAANLIGGAIHAFADGGIVNGPTLALVGEAGPEAIIPLSAFAGGNTLSGGGIGGSSPGGGIVVNITGTFLSRDAARQLGDLLAQGVNRQIRLKSYV